MSTLIWIGMLPPWSTLSVVCSVCCSVPGDPTGCRRLLVWMGGYGLLERVGVEGTGSYGAGLSRHLLEAGLVVLEVTRPNRQKRHRNGKDDELDAIEAARAVIAGRAVATARTSSGHSEALRELVGAQRSIWRGPWMSDRSSSTVETLRRPTALWWDSG